MKVKMLKLFSPLVVLALALSLMAGVVLPQTASASPAEWHVSTMGSDTTGDGSSGNPWRTIQHAVDNAGVSDGDTIIVHEGTYIENVEVYKELTVQAAPGYVTVQAAIAGDDVFRVEADYVTISGFTVTGATQLDAAGIFLQPETDGCTITNNTAVGNKFGICLQASNDNIISGNTASENELYGIYLNWGSNNNIISGNTASENEHSGIYQDMLCHHNTIEGNTASGNEDGIYLTEGSHHNTIEGNTASENKGSGIFLASPSGDNTISGNTASGNEGCGISLSGSRNNTVTNNTCENNGYYGIWLDCFSVNNTIEGNTASDNSVGIELTDSSHSNALLYNTIHDNGDGIYSDSSGNLFLGNDISGNYGENSGVHLGGYGTGNQFVFNNIVNNTDGESYGVYSEGAVVDARLNWWGAASGPSGVGPGTGDAVSDNVNFEPWLAASVVVEDITGAQEDVEISGPTGSDTTLTVSTSGDVTVIVALYSGNPEEPFPGKALGKYIDIYASDPDAIVWPVHVEMSYTEDEVAAAGIDESKLGLYYWDASANQFHRCADTGVDTAANIIWANVTEAEAGGLAGTPFTAGAAPGGLSIGVIVGIVIGVCAAAGLIAYFIIRRRRAAG